MRRSLALIIVAILPLFVYPVFFGFAVLSNVLVGDRSFIFSLTYDSLGKLRMIILTDWYASLPVSYVIVVLMLFPMHLALQRLRFSSGAVLLLLASLGGWLFSYLIGDQDIWGRAVFIFCGATLAGLLHVSMQGARVISARIKS